MTYVLVLLLVVVAWKLHQLETRQKETADKASAAVTCVGAIQADILTANQKVDKAAKKVAEIDRRTTPGAMTQEQIDFKADLEKRWKTAMEQARADLAEQLVMDKNKLKLDVDKYKMGFEAMVKKAYDEACARIDFDRVEYKKTITKKRKEFARKHKATEAQKSYRSIDDV